MRRMIAAGAVLVAVTAGCGGDGPPADEAVADAYMAAIVAGDAGGVWDTLHPMIRAELDRVAFGECIAGLYQEADVAVDVRASFDVSERLDGPADATVLEGVVVLEGGGGSDRIPVQVWVADGDDRRPYVVDVRTGVENRTECFGRPYEELAG